MKMITLSLFVIPPIREITGGKYKSGQNSPIFVLEFAGFFQEFDVFSLKKSLLPTISKVQIYVIYVFFQ